MKDLYDIYEDGVVSTPNNTMGMGNPTPPTDDNVGSEPLCGKGKCKRKKKKVEEGLLTKTATKVKDFSIVDLFVEWLVDTQVVGSMSKEAAFINYKKQIIDNGDGTFDIDTRNCEDSKYRIYGLIIPKAGIPEWLSIRNIYMNDYCFYITTYNNNLGALDWTIYSGNKLSDLEILCKSGDDLSLGAVKCKTLLVYAKLITEFEFAPDIEIEILNVENCSKLKSMSNIPKCVKNLVLSRNVAAETLKSYGFIPDTTNVKI